MKLSPFPNYFKNLKELFDLIISKINSAGGDLPSIFEIALFINKTTYNDRLFYIFYSLWTDVLTMCVTYLTNNNYDHVYYRNNKRSILYTCVVFIQVAAGVINWIQEIFRDNFRIMIIEEWDSREKDA